MKGYFNIVNSFFLLGVIGLCAASRYKHDKLDDKHQANINVTTCSRNYEEAFIKQYVLEKLRPTFLSILSKETDKLEAILQNVQTKMDRAEISEKYIKTMAPKLNFFEEMRSLLRERIKKLDSIQERLNNTTTLKKCPSTSWYVYEDVCYLFVPEGRVNWEQAKEICQSLGNNGNLVTIKTAAVNNFIGQHGNEKRYWTAGNDLATEGTWKWYPENQPFNFTYWSINEPNNVGNTGQGDCMVIYTDYKKWRDKNCRSDQFGYICQHTLMPSK